MNPLVTIAVPTFDRLHYLKEAVASALAQAYSNVEVIIGDDGGCEGIREWGRGVVAQDARVRYQTNEKRLGLAGNWNALARAARGEFLVIIGDDDRLLPDFVGKLLSAIRPGGDVAFANHYLINSRGERLEAESAECTRTYGRHLLSAGEVRNAPATVWQNSVPMSAALLRTDAVRRLSFKEELNTPEIELFARMAEEGARFVFVPEYLAEYRTHSQSATSAGLRSELLAQRLIPLAVPPDVEKYKRQLLAPLLVNAVSRCLQQGNRELARRLLQSEYYPRPERTVRGRLSRAGPQSAAEPARREAVEIFRDALRTGVQELCARLPGSIGSPLYRMIRRVKSAGACVAPRGGRGA